MSNICASAGKQKESGGYLARPPSAVLDCQILRHASLPVAQAFDRIRSYKSNPLLRNVSRGLPFIPFAAAHELIRRRRWDLTHIGPISDILFDQPLGARCVRCIIAAWVGSVSAGLGHNYRQAVKQAAPAPIEVHIHSNLTMALAPQAGALGAPPTLPG